MASLYHKQYGYKCTVKKDTIKKHCYIYNVVNNQNASLQSVKKFH